MSAKTTTKKQEERFITIVVSFMDPWPCPSFVQWEQKPQCARVDPWTSELIVGVHPSSAPLPEGFTILYLVTGSFNGKLIHSSSFCPSSIPVHVWRSSSHLIPQALDGPGVRPQNFPHKNNPSASQQWALALPTSLSSGSGAHGRVNLCKPGIVYLHDAYIHIFTSIWSESMGFCNKNIHI